MRPEIEGISVVLLGAFNPVIFQPAWFASENLIRKQENETAKIDIVHREAVIFTTDWLKVEVTRERFVLATSQVQYYEPLRDLALGTFRILHHTPIEKMGLNREFHFLMESEKEWHAIGDALAPKKLWSGVLESPGMMSIVMQGKRTDKMDKMKGAINVKVEPSPRVKPGVFIQVNDHYEVEDFEPSKGAGKIIDLVSMVWKESLSRAEFIAGKVMESAK